MESQNNTPQEAGLSVSKKSLDLGGYSVLHQHAEIFSKWKSHKAQGDWIGCDKIADIKDAGSPTVLLANQMLS
jgi:hypothetical protein